MRVLIDGVEAKLVDERVTLPLYRFSSLRSVEGWREGESVDVEVVATSELSRLFGVAEQMHRTECFNDSYHSATIEADGVAVYKGVATLVAARRSGESVVYRVRIRVGGAEWADDAAMTRLADTAIEGERVMTVGGVEESWSDDGAVRMLPLHRDSYAEEAATGISVPQQTLQPQDYHPFISVRAVIDSIVQGSGYRLCSNFLETPLEKRLMISGAYKRVESEQAYASMGFKALRTRSATATASPIGRVDAWFPEGGSNVGIVVDTVNPNTLDENGLPSVGAYDNGGCFTFESGVPMFRPKREISAAFDLHLHYTTDYRIISSTKLRGFDKIDLGNECYVDVGLQNNFHDVRNELQSGVRYRLFIFDYDPTTTYLLRGCSAQITSEITTITFPAGFAGETDLYARGEGQTGYRSYEGDWAIYEAYVEPEGRREVEVTVRMPYESLSPSSPKIFNHIFFYGADEGQRLTLHAGCSLVPIFGGVAGYGQRIRFKDVANHDISQAQLLESVAHMFNLCLYTHRPTKRLYIETYDEFFNGAVEDWRDRQLGDDVEIEECVVDSFLMTRLGYQPTDGATKRLTEGEEFGMWSVAEESYATKQSVCSILNPLLAPTASMRGAVGVAPSASVLVVGERDVVDASEYVTPRVALYYGMQQLPLGEHWPMGYNNRSYPLVAFHIPERGETLCFEDRDGCQGLHRFYDNQLREGAERQRVTLQLRLSPAEYVALFDPDNNGATIRSRFRLQVGGNSSLFRLDEVVEYDAERGVAKCRFQRLMQD